MNTKHVSLVVIACAAVLASFAESYTWNGGASGEWTSSANWLPATGYPNGAEDTAAFSPSAATAVTVGSAVSVKGITVGGTGALTVTGSAIALGADGIASTSTAAVGISNDLAVATAATPLAVTGPATLSASTPAGPLHLAGVISGAGGLYKSGAGELHLYGANTFTGDFEAIGTGFTKAGVAIGQTTVGSGETFIYDGSALGATHAYFDKGKTQTNSLGARLNVMKSMTVSIPIQLTGDYNNNYSMLLRANVDVTFTGAVDSKGRARLQCSYANAKARFKGELKHTNYLDLHLYASGAEVFLHKPIYGSTWWADGGNGGKVHLFGTGGTSVNWFQASGIAVCEAENVIPPELNYFQVETANCGIELSGYNQEINKVNLAKLNFKKDAVEKITSPEGYPAKMRFVGTDILSFGMVAQFEGTAGMEWDPQNAETVYTQSNTVSATTGELDVKSGVYRLANGATFTKLSSFKLADGARFEVDAGSGARFLAMNAVIGSGAAFVLGEDVNLSFGTLKIGSDTIPEGTELTAASHPGLVTGAGRITVTGARPPAYWKGASGGRWNDAANWSIGQVPDMNYDAVLTNASVLVDAAITPVHAITVGDGVKAATITITNLNSTLTANHVTIADKGVVTCVGPFTNETDMSRVHIVCTNLEIMAGGKIDVTQKGWSGAVWTNKPGQTTYAVISHYGYGPGAGGPLTGNWSGFSGAWHGGRGAAYWLLSNTDKLIYGDAAHPTTPGSGGELSIGYGGSVLNGVRRGWSGGGVVRIEAANRVIVDGSILADGGGPNNNGANRDTAASGGSVWITCRTISGAGTVSAAGGSGGDPRYPVSYWRNADTTDPKNGFPGGGGRIAIDYDPEAQAEADVDGLFISAAAGEHYSGYSSLATRDNWEDAAENGTLHFTDTALVKRLFGNGLSGRVVGLTGLSFDGDLEFRRGFIQTMEEGFTLTVAGNLVVTGETARLEVGGVCMTNLSSRPTVWGGRQMNLLTVGGDFTVTDGGSFAIRAAETNASMRWGAEVRIAGAMTIGSNGWVYAASDGVNFGAPRFLAGSLTVAKDGVLSADKRGGLGRHVDSTRRSLGFPEDLNGYYGFGPGGGYKPNAAGHGGRGGRSGIVNAQLYGIYGETYDDEWFPIWPGSGGGCDGSITVNCGSGGTGGGIIHVTTPGAITVNGRVSADGGMDAFYSTDQMYRFGAGSGGTVFLFGETFTGGAEAQITARGGDGYQRQQGNQLSGTGGGGRIAIWAGYGAHENGSFRTHKRTACPFEFGGSFSAAAGVRLIPPNGTLDYTDEEIAYSIGEAGTVRFGEFVRLPGSRFIVR